MGEYHCLRKKISRCSCGVGTENFTLTFPNLFAIEDARSMEIAAMMLVVKKREPSFPGSRLNLSWKKNVTHDL